MGTSPEIQKAEIVLIDFPFSDLSGSKIRPALVIGCEKEEDILVCQITSKEREDKHSILLERGDFENGSLRETSNIRPNKIFSANKKIIFYKIGKIKKDKFYFVRNKILNLIVN